MYPVSEAFLQAVQENTRRDYWTGRITTTKGSTLGKTKGRGNKVGRRINVVKTKAGRSSRTKKAAHKSRTELDKDTKKMLDQVFGDFSKLELYILMKEFGFLGDKARKMTAKELSYQDYFVGLAKEDKDGKKNIEFGNVKIERPGRNKNLNEEVFVESVYYVKEKFYSNKVAKIKKRLAGLKDAISMEDVVGCLEDYCIRLWKERYM